MFSDDNLRVMQNVNSSMIKTLLYSSFAFALIIGSFFTRGVFGNYGQRTAYLTSPSSACEIVDAIVENTTFLRRDLKGESVTLASVGELDLLLKRFRAKKTFSESGDGFYCEYYYSPKLYSYAVVNGLRVNLHASYFSDGSIRVGTPINFGSF